MGAGNSTPRQVTFENPSPQTAPQGPPLVVTRGVMERIEASANERAKKNPSGAASADPLIRDSLNSPWSSHPYLENSKGASQEFASNNQKGENSKQASSEDNSRPALGGRIPEDLTTGPEVPEAPFPTSNTNRQNYSPNPMSHQEADNLGRELFQKNQLDETFNRIDKILKKSPKWYDQHGEFIKTQKENLVECYKSEEKRSMFECEKLAKDFQKRLWDIHYKSLNEQDGKNSQKTDTK